MGQVLREAVWPSSMAGARGRGGLGGLGPCLLQLVRRVGRLLVATLRPVRPRHVQPQVYHVWAAVRPHAWARLYLLLGQTPAPPRYHPAPQVSTLPPSQDTCGAAGARLEYQLYH